MARATKALLVLVLMSIAAPAQGTEYVTARDTEVAADAAAVKAETCAASSENDEVDVETGRAEIADTVGDENIVLTALKEEDTKEKAMERVLNDIVDPALIVRLAYPILFAVLFTIVYFCLACTACPCCKCLRACKKPHPVPQGKRCKGLLLFGLLGAMVWILVSGLLTMTGYGFTTDGFDNFACGSATFVDTALMGSTDPYFIGMMPVLQTIEGMVASFGDDSQMLQDLDAVIDGTEPVEVAVMLAGRALAVLGASMEMTENVNPKNAGEDLIHKCVLCQELGAPLQTAGKALNDGVGSALTEARSSVKQAITPEMRSDMQSSLKAATQPLIDFKVSMRDTLGGFIEEGGVFEQVRTIMHEQANLAVMSFFVLAMFILCCACGSSGWFLMFETNSQGGHNKGPHRWACCVWCCSFFPTILIFIVGGVMLLISFPIASVCDVMDKLDANMIDDVGSALGLPAEGDDSEMAIDIMSHCLVPSDKSMNANMMSLVFSRDANGTKVTTRDTFVKTVTDPINLAFDTLDQSMGGGAMPKLATDPEIVKIRSILGNNPISAFYLPVNDKLDNADFQAMLADDDLRIGAATSMSCPDVTPQGIENPAGAENGGAIYGIDSFNLKMDGKGNVALPSTHPCLKTYTCLSDVAACQSANKLVALKEKMASPNTVFMCSRFLTGPTGTTCSLKDMQKDANNAWENDCIHTASDGTKSVHAENYACTLQQFEDYVKEFDTILQKVFGRLDSEAEYFATQISVDLKDLVDTHLVGPAMKIVEGVNCGFMAQFYDTVVESLCFQGVFGIRMVAKSYVLLAFGLVFLTIMLYVQWRRTIDNVNAHVAQQKSGGQA